MNYRPQHTAESQGHRWLISYADMVTILLVLFVAVSARGLHRTEVRPTTPSSQDGLRGTQRILEQRGLRPKIEARGLVVSLPQTVLFPSGDDRVNPAAGPLLGQISDAVRGIPNKVMLVGHADAVPIRNQRFRDNWDLSMARSLSLLEELRDGYGIPEARLSVAGYGSTSPQKPNDSEGNRALNRRVEIVILHEPVR